MPTQHWLGMWPRPSQNLKQIKTVKELFSCSDGDTKLTLKKKYLYSTQILNLI